MREARKEGRRGCKRKGGGGNVLSGVSISGGESKEVAGERGKQGREREEENVGQTPIKPSTVVTHASTQTPCDERTCISRLLSPVMPCSTHLAMELWTGGPGVIRGTGNDLSRR